MDIPETRFTVYLVLESSSHPLGVYQTFEQAYNRILGVRNVPELFQCVVSDQCIRYVDVSKPEHYFDIYNCPFYYDSKYPMITNLKVSFDESEPSCETIIVNH